MRASWPARKAAALLCPAARLLKRLPQVARNFERVGQPVRGVGAAQDGRHELIVTRPAQARLASAQHHKLGAPQITARNLDSVRDAVIENFAS